MLRLLRNALIALVLPVATYGADNTAVTFHTDPVEVWAGASSLRQFVSGWFCCSLHYSSAGGLRPGRFPGASWPPGLSSCLWWLPAWGPYWFSLALYTVSSALL